LALLEALSSQGLTSNLDQSCRIHKVEVSLCFCLLSPILLCLIWGPLIYLFRTLQVLQWTLSAASKLSLGLVFSMRFSVFCTIISDVALVQTVGVYHVLSVEFYCPF